MYEEIDDLNKNQTWELMSKPENCELITCKWVYRLKKHSDGVGDKYKAHLVARGFSQSYGLDYEETFSQVLKMVTIRTIFSLEAPMNWKLLQLDVKNAFHYGELDSEALCSIRNGVSLCIILNMFIDLRERCMVLNKHDVRDMVKFPNTLSFVPLKFLMQILVYFLNLNQKCT